MDCLLVRNLIPDARDFIALDEPSRWILVLYNLYDGSAEKVLGFLGTVSVELPVAMDETTIPHVPTMKDSHPTGNSSTHHVMVMWQQNTFRQGVPNRKGWRGNGR
jgi:hypothetical protein